MAETLSTAGLGVLNCPAPEQKAALSLAAATAWRQGELSPVGWLPPVDAPARPETPILISPRDMPRRRAAGNLQNRIALLHALAHIELNAIDLAWDIVTRFGHLDLPHAFFDDWIKVADDEARHFMLLQTRLQELGASYGDLPAHDGLWQHAVATSDDLLARLAVVPLVLEARGLDVSPATIEKLQAGGDLESARILTIIYTDEIDHVAAGARWFNSICIRLSRDPEETFQSLVRQHFKGTIRPPFNKSARDQAGLPETFYSGFVSP